MDRILRESWSLFEKEKTLYMFPHLKVFREVLDGIKQDKRLKLKKLVAFHIKDQCQY